MNTIWKTCWPPFCAVWGMADAAVMAQVARSFKGVEHRIEPVRTLNGVQWFNDSIASSPTRVIAGLRAFSQKLIILAGGSEQARQLRAACAGAAGACENAGAYIEPCRKRQRLPRGAKAATRPRQSR